MEHPDDISKEVQDIIDNAELTIEQRIDSLREVLMGNAFFLIEKAQRGQTITPEEDAMQAAMMKRFTEIEKIYNGLMKSNRLSASSNGSFNKGVLDAIKRRKSSVSGIVVSNTNSSQ